MPKYIDAITASGLTIDDPIEIGHPDLWIPSEALESLLNDALRGLSFGKAMALRTRSKVLKLRVCEILGYPVPKKFRRLKPKFTGQNFDIYLQKSRNLQIWNDEPSPTRRYVIVQVSEDNSITVVKVVTGAALAELDTTGTLTQKYQARLTVRDEVIELISAADTLNLQPLLTDDTEFVPSRVSPVSPPAKGSILPIAEVFRRLQSLIGHSFPDRGRDQERNRGADLHREVCRALGFGRFQDDGQFPDIPNQLIEVKLQTARTIDLGLVTPNSIDPLDMTQIDGTQLVHSDVRYVIFYANTDGENVTLTHLYVTTGQDFFSRFPQFGGKVLNKKLQIHLPADFFT